MSISRKMAFSGTDIKKIAMITMLIDHLAASVLYGYLTLPGTTAAEGWYDLYQLMRLIGRLAFPLYCFLLVEGFLHTRSVGRYLLRLLLFALISELPFDLALQRSSFAPSQNNVFFTLALGLVLLWVTERLSDLGWKEEKALSAAGIGEEGTEDRKKGRKVFFGIAILAAVMIAGFVAERVLCSDYGMAGILAIFVLYLFRKDRELAYCLAVLVLTLFAGSTEILAIFLLPLIGRYDGTRGGNPSRAGSLFFYAFYPGHLLLLWALTEAVRAVF